MSTPRLVLGSASPRRQRILARLGYGFDIVAADVPEVHDPRDPVATVVSNALSKHEHVRRCRPHDCLITADTLVSCSGELIGKPRDMEQAAEMLRAFSGRAHLVFTAVVLSLPACGPDIRVEASTVHFRDLDEGTILRYLERTQPLDRAGAYDIEESGDLLVAYCSGSYTNVMGLPAETVADWLMAHGIQPCDGVRTR